MGDIRDFFGDEFDTSQYEPTQDFSALPPGDYNVEVEKAEVRETKAGNGHYIWLQLSVVGDKYANRKVFDNLNIDNPSKVASDIGRSKLADLGKACNGGNDVTITDTSQLIGQVVCAKLTVKDDQNVVRKYKPIGGPVTAQNNSANSAAGNPVHSVKNESEVKSEFSCDEKPPWLR